MPEMWWQHLLFKCLDGLRIYDMPRDVIAETGACQGGQVALASYLARPRIAVRSQPAAAGQRCGSREIRSVCDLHECLDRGFDMCGGNSLLSQLGTNEAERISAR